MAKDYYHILGVNKSATQDEIKKAFRSLAHQHHPDKQGGNEAKFKEINEAYQVLSDEKKRAQYDQFGSAAFDGSAGGGQGFGGWDFSGFSAGGGPGSAWQSAGFEDLGDIFGRMFSAGGGSAFGGGGRSSSRTRRGSDIQVDVQLSFKEAVFGLDKELTLSKQSSCDRCGGNGAEPGKGVKTCSTCHGEGVVISVQRTILGNMQTKRTCNVCFGSGEIPSLSCTTCRGEGIEKKRKTFTVTIPAGVEEGSVLRVRGEGEAIKGGVTGDLFVRISVKSDSRFDREGTTIYSEKNIGFTQAALGDTVSIETVDGFVDLSIPAGTQSNTQFRLRGKGVPVRGDRGDHIVVVHVKTPQKLSKEQRKMLETLGLNE